MLKKVCSLFLAALLVAAPVVADVQIKSGATTDTLTIEPAQKAARVTSRPTDVGSLGSYAISGTTGTIAAGMAANGVIAQFRWTSGAAVALIRKVSIGAASGATGFAAGVASCGIVLADNYTVTGTTGSSSIATTGSEGKRRTSHATSSVANGDIRVSATAASTGQTWTLNTADAARVGPFTVTTAVQTNFIPVNTLLWSPDVNTEWPLVLEQNEGFAVRCTVPATGVWTAVVNVEWTEVASF